MRMLLAILLGTALIWVGGVSARDQSPESILIDELNQQLDYLKMLAIPNAMFTEKQFGDKPSLVCENFWHNQRQDISVPQPSVIGISRIEKQKLYKKLKAAALFNRRLYFANGNNVADKVKYENDFQYLWLNRKELPSSFNLPNREAQLLFQLEDSATGYKQIVYVEAALDITFNEKLATPYEFGERGISITLSRLTPEGTLKPENSAHTIGIDPINAAEHGGLATLDGSTPAYWTIKRGSNTWVMVSPIPDSHGHSVDCHIRSN